MTVEKTKIPSKNADDADDFFFKWLANKSALVQSHEQDLCTRQI